MTVSASPERLDLPRYTVGVRLFMLALLGGLAALFVGLTPLALHSSELRCAAPGQCVHVERYPLGFDRTAPVKAVTNADALEVRERGGPSVRLRLHHADGIVTEYLGVGARGERAAAVADALVRWLAAPAPGEQRFELRDGSAVMAGLLLALALVALGLAPHFFTRVQLARSDAALTVRIGRWPAPARAVSLSLASLRAIAVQRQRANEQAFFAVVAEVEGAAPVALGWSFRSEAAAEARAAEVRAVAGRG